MKNKKATINPKNKDGRISKIKPFINKCNLKERDFPSHDKDWKKFESIALNILYVPYNTENIRHAYNLKYNLTRENHVILLMINTDSEKWHYLAVKSLSALFRGIAGKNNRDF